MSEENTQPIVIKKINKGGHAHGGAWKIAYADFVTAMMAFFLLMWLVGSTTREEKMAIADFFNNPSFVAGEGGASASKEKVGGGKDITRADATTQAGPTQEKQPEIRPPNGEVGQISQEDKQRLLDLRKELEQTIDASATLKPFKDQLLIEITKEGLRIQILDKENRPMFALGSSTLLPYAAQLLKEIGSVINHVPNRISLSGHTDAAVFVNAAGTHYSNWELSADRANAARRALQEGGMSEAKMVRVVGLSSSVLLDKQNPLNPTNRRISIIVLNREAEESLLHDEGKLDQTTAESSAAAQPTAAKAPEAPAPKAVPPAPEVKPTPAVPAPLPAAPPPAPAKPAAPVQTPPETKAPPPAPAAPKIVPVAPPASIVAPLPLPVVNPGASAPAATAPNVKPAPAAPAAAVAPKPAAKTAPAAPAAKPAAQVTQTATTTTTATTTKTSTAGQAKPPAQATPPRIVPIAPIVAPIALPVAPADATATAAAASAAAAAAAGQSGSK